MLLRRGELLSDVHCNFGVGRLPVDNLGASVATVSRGLHPRGSNCAFFET